VQADVRRVVTARATLTKALADAGLVVTPSGANFLWAKTPGPAEPVFTKLAEEGVLVRSFHAAGGRLASQLRITVGTDEENAKLIDALKKALA
jgi:histidinol-phosphate aminotransferase